MRSATVHRGLVPLACATAIVLLAGCGGSPTVKVVTAAPKATTSGASASSAAPASPSVSASDSAQDATTPNGCVSSAVYCDTFTDKSSGWQVANETNYYVGYDPYDGGSYRMGARSDNAALTPAPFDITKASSSDNVQIDVDAIVGNTAPSSAKVGILCWYHQAKDGSNPAAFGFFAGQQSSAVILYNDQDGSAQSIASKDLPTGLTPGHVNHLTATCVQNQDGAQLQLAVNGQPVIAQNYPRTSDTYPWATGDRVGLAVAGQGSDVFFKNFGVSAASGGAPPSSASGSGPVVTAPISDAASAVTILANQAKNSGINDDGYVAEWGSDNKQIQFTGFNTPATPLAVSGIADVTSKAKNVDYVPFAVMDTSGHCSGAVLEVSGKSVTKVVPVPNVPGKCTAGSVSDAAGY